MVQIRRLLVLLLLVICVGLLTTSCRPAINHNNKDKTIGDYEINYYVDTISNHVVLTTVVNSTKNISSTTIKLN